MHIDYISLSFPKVEIRSMEDGAIFGAELFGERWQDALESNPREFYATKATAPFNAALHSPLGVIQWKRHKQGAMLSCSGKAMARLDWHWIQWACSEMKVTRIDIAHDIHNPDAAITPASIVRGSISKSRSEMHSETGDTYYLGSFKSDAMTRVYMYNKPNPRAGVPRVEHQFRRKYAQQVARLVAQGRMYDVYETRNKALSLSTDASATDAHTTTRFVQPVRSDDDSKKAAWILKSVRPTLCRLLREGVIKASELFDEETANSISLELFGEVLMR